MASLKTKFSVGLFLIIGIALGIVAIIWLGMSNYLEKGRFFAAYFDESVQGLDKDSPVKYRGVRIGRVHRIDVAPDEHLIEVILKIESDVQPQRKTDDIVAQLKSVGITGLMFIELERKLPPKADQAPILNFDPPYPVVPTRPSEISQIFKGIDDVINVIRDLDTKSISSQLSSALQKINQTIDKAELNTVVQDVHTTVNQLQKVLAEERWNRLFTSLEQTADSFNSAAIHADQSISDIRQTIKHLDNLIAASENDIQQLTADLKSSASQIKRTMEATVTLLENTDQNVEGVQQQFITTLQRIDRASDSLNRLLERITNQPSDLIFSNPPPDKPEAP